MSVELVESPKSQKELTGEGTDVLLKLPVASTQILSGPEKLV